MDSNTLLDIKELTIRFPTEYGTATAVNQLNLTLKRGKILGLVGESGCGKSLTSLAILRLIPKPGQITHGSIHLNVDHPAISQLPQQDLLLLPDQAMRQLRGATIAYIPQDPLTSLNPVYTIGNQIMEILALHQGLKGRAAQQKAIDLLDQVRLPNAKARLHDYPHEFSGGMRQRVMIAMALSCEPELLIADEPTTALDVTVQAQILAIMKSIQQARQTTILLITHDLGVVAETCDQVAVMYAGRIVEEADVNDIFKRPKHPYTQGLLNSLPTATHKRLEPIEGHPPSIMDIPNGCAFEPRCKDRMPVCTQAFPDRTTLQPGHEVRCYLYSGS